MLSIGVQPTSSAPYISKENKLKDNFIHVEHDISTNELLIFVNGNIYKKILLDEIQKINIPSDIVIRENPVTELDEEEIKASENQQSDQEDISEEIDYQEIQHKKREDQVRKSWLEQCTIQ